MRRLRQPNKHPVRRPVTHLCSTLAMRVWYGMPASSALICMPNSSPDDIDRPQKERPRRHVMASFATSLGDFDRIYRELAK